MALTTVVTRDVEARYRGFLTSVMLEVAPGVYVAPDLNQGVRDRVWDVMTRWWEALGRGALIMIWRDLNAPGNLQIRTLGTPAKTIVDAEEFCSLNGKIRGDTRPTLFDI